MIIYSFLFFTQVYKMNPSGTHWQRHEYRIQHPPILKIKELVHEPIPYVPAWIYMPKWH
ncbi:hypothetical protein EMIT0194MI4_90203 [Pseudomonas sp. IT-194MI4]